MKNTIHDIPGKSVILSSKLKVMHLIASPKIGGAEKLLLTIVDNIDFDRFDVSIAAYIDSKVELNNFYNEAVKSSARLFPVKIRHPYDIRQLIQIYRIIATVRPDVIHTHGYKTNILGFLMARLFKIPNIATVHGWLHTNRKITQLFNRLNLCLLRRFDQVIAVSEQIENVLLRRGVPASRLVTLRNVPAAKKQHHFDKAAFLEKYSLLPEARCVGFVGRLEPVKGADVFIAAAPIVLESCPDAQFLIAGEGSELIRLKATVEKLGLGRQVKFLGFLASPGAFFQVLDLYVLPSRDEGIPLSLLEAMSVGVPVVASSVGGVPEVIKDGMNGILVPPGQSRSLAEAICRSLNDQDGGSQRIQAAQQTINERFNIDSWIQRLQTLYVDLRTRTV